MDEFIKSLLYVLLFGSIIGCLLPDKRFEKYIKPLISIIIVTTIIISFISLGKKNKSYNYTYNKEIDFNNSTYSCYQIITELSVKEAVKKFNKDITCNVEAEMSYEDGTYTVKRVDVLSSYTDNGELEKWLRVEIGLENIYVNKKN